jgi:hypothetical protein
MIELNAVPHDTNFAHITITRLGDVRNTRYQISQSEAKQPAKFSYAARAEELTQEFIRSKHGHDDSDQTKEG